LSNRIITAISFTITQINIAILIVINTAISQFLNAVINRQDHTSYDQVSNRCGCYTTRFFIVAKRKQRRGTVWDTTAGRCSREPVNYGGIFSSHRRVPLTSSYERRSRGTRGRDYARIDWASNRRKSPRTWHRAVMGLLPGWSSHVTAVMLFVITLNMPERSLIALTDVESQVRATLKFLKRKDKVWFNRQLFYKCTYVCDFNQFSDFRINFFSEKVQRNNSWLQFFPVVSL